MGRIRIRDVARRHIDAAVRALAPVSRSRAIAFASRLFAEFERWGWRDPNTNPARGIPRARENPRDRILTGDELARLSQALDAAEAKRPASVAALRVAAMSGLRIGEVLSMRWEDIDFASGRVVLPHTKTGPRVHDLPPQALDAIAGLPRVIDHVFTADLRAATTYRTVRRHWVDACEAAGIKGARIHDLRRTVATRAAAGGASAHVLRDLLGHSTLAMASRYVRALGDPVAEARRRVGSEIAAAMAGDSADVVELRG